MKEFKTEFEIEKFMENENHDYLDYSDDLDTLTFDDLSLLMWKLIEKNVTQDTTQRHMMFDVVCALERKRD
jgi:retron-type reverse transcriptase